MAVVLYRCFFYSVHNIATCICVCYFIDRFREYQSYAWCQDTNFISEEFDYGSLGVVNSKPNSMHKDEKGGILIPTSLYLIQFGHMETKFENQDLLQQI